MRVLDKTDIICGVGGLNASKSPDLLRDTDLTAMESITLEQDTWQKEGGAVKFNSVAVPVSADNDPEIRAMFHFRTDAGVHELVCVTKQDRIVIVGAAGVTKTVADIAGAAFRHSPLVEGSTGSGKGLYHFNGSAGIRPRVYTGDSTAYQFGLGVGTFTANAGTDVLTCNAHGLANDERVFVTNSGGALPAGLSADSLYFVANTAANTFQLSSLAGGAGIINFTTNGTGTHSVHRSTIPVDWDSGVGTGLGNPIWGFQHGGRMFAGGSSDHPHDVYTSKLNLHQDFKNSGALYFPVYPGEGDLIVGGISFRQKAYVFKYPKGIYVLDDSSVDTAEWGWKRVSRYVGAVGPGSIVEADDEVYFVSPDGYIHALSSVQEQGDVRSSAIKPMELGAYIRQNTDFSKLGTAAFSTWSQYPQPQSVYYATKKKVLFAFSAKPNVTSAQGFPVNKVLISLDLHRSDAQAGIRDVQVGVSTRDECESLAIYRDPSTGEPVLLAGASNGFIYKLDQTARSKDSAGYMGSFTTKEFYPYGGEQNANMKELEVTFAPGSSNNSIVIKVYQNGTLAKTKTLTDSNRWMRLTGDCLKFYIVGENNTLNSSFSVSKITVRYTPGNWRKHS